MASFKKIITLIQNAGSSLTKFSQSTNNATNSINKSTAAIERNTRALNKNAQASNVIVAKVEANAKRRYNAEERANLNIMVSDRRAKNSLLVAQQKHNNATEREEQKHLNRMEEMREKYRLKQASKSSSGGGFSLSNLFAGYYLVTRAVSALTSITDVSDTALSTKARLGLYNQSQYSNDELYDMMYMSSQRSRTGLEDTSDLVNRILVSGAMEGAGAATESIRIAEIINKASVAGGGTRDEIQRSLRQLAQGLSSGTLQGDELRSIREQTPFLAQMLAEGLNKVAPELGGNLAIGDLKDLGGEGELTAERILKAFSAMEEDINEKFNAMPRTFAQSMTQINNVWTKFIANLSTTGGALSYINKIASEIADYLMSEKGQTMLSRLANSLSGIASTLYTIWSYVSPILGALLESGPVIETLIGSLTVLLGLGLANKISDMVIKMGTMGKAGLYVAGVMLAVAGASTVASLAFQAMGDDADTANKKVQASWDSMGYHVMGVLGLLGTAIITGVSLVADFVLLIIEDTLRVASMAINGLIAGVQGIGWVGAKVVDAVTANKWDLSSKVESGLSNTANTITRNWQEFNKTEESFENTLGGGTSLHKGAFNMMDTVGNYWFTKGDNAYKESWDKQEKTEQQLSKMTNLLDKMSSEDFTYHVGDVDKVNGTVDITSEDLKLLKDIATRDLLLSMTSVTPQANITFGDVKETADVGKIMDVIEDMVENAFATSLVYNN